jgi:glycosyltransferase involved in cell wall biosynthesis
MSRQPRAQRPFAPDLDITAVVRAHEDEERIGLVLARIARHLTSLGCRFEILVADEGSGDNTVAVAVLMRQRHPEVEVLHAPSGRGLTAACERARGRAILLYDARTDAPLAGLGWALERLRAGVDIVAVSGRWLVLRRTRTWRAFDALAGVPRDPRVVERRLLRRARSLGFVAEVTQKPSHRLLGRSLAALRDALLAPLAVRL